MGLQGFLISREVAAQTNLEKSNRVRHWFRLVGVSDQAYRDSKIIFVAVTNFVLFLANLGMVFLTKAIVHYFKPDAILNEYCAKSILRIVSHSLAYFISLPSFYMLVGLLLRRRTKNLVDIVSLIEGVQLLL